MAKRILIVGYDQLLRRSLAFNLEQAGYEVKSAANAEDVIDILRGAGIGLPGIWKPFHALAATFLINISDSFGEFRTDGTEKEAQNLYFLNHRG